MCIHTHILLLIVTEGLCEILAAQNPNFRKTAEKRSFSYFFHFAHWVGSALEQKSSAPTPHPNVRVGDKHPLCDNRYKELRAQYPKAPMQFLFWGCYVSWQGLEYTSKQETTQEVLGKLRTEEKTGLPDKGFGC